ncbi:unnamed protein product [Triticum turgidum subsp. durum]|uniref:Uncharacterized protein n=1 Tax=Triticum turgidum subsp. durum TaxID=4567 RepID=A0A9R0QK05_TRITD|nr:unnamed protein product [Triticum turgidum subsp. durum]
MGMAPLVRSLPLLVLLVTLSSTTLPSSRAMSGDGDKNDLLMLGRFHRWMSAHGRTYHSAAEKLRRFEVYRRNVDLIDASNREAERLGYELGENEFTDLTNEEFMAWYVGGAYGGAGDGGGLITTLAGDVAEQAVSSKNAVEEDRNLTMTAADPPRHFDWREHGVVTPAKQQGACGCCWAFAAAATVESLNKIKGGELVDLSVQELVDCSTGVFSSPCGYGWPKSALEWIKSKGGLFTEAEYPYLAKARQMRGAQRRSTHRQDHRRPGGAAGEQRQRAGTGRAQDADDRPERWEQLRAAEVRVPRVQWALYHQPEPRGDDRWLWSHCRRGRVLDRQNSWRQTWGQKGFFVRRGADGPCWLCGIAM